MIQNSSKLYTFQFGLLCLSHALFSASFNMIIPELPAYLTSMGGAEYKGLIIALFTVTAALARPFSGKLADTIGRVPVMIIGTLVCVVCSFFYPFVTTVFGFLVLRFFHGFTTGFKPTATVAYAADIVPDTRRGEAMGILGVSMNLGASASPIFGSYLVKAYSMNAMFYASSFVALLSILILLTLAETLENKQKFRPQLLKISRNEIIYKNAIPPAIVCVFLYSCYGVILTVVPDQSDFLGISNKGYFLASLTVFSMLSRLVAGRTSDKWGRLPVLKVAIFLVCLSLAYMAMVTTPFGLIAASGCLGFAMGIASPAVFAWAIDVCEDAFRGRAMATIYIALEIGIGLGALLSAEIYNSNPENFDLTFLISAAFTGIALIYLLLRKEEKLV